MGLNASLAHFKSLNSQCSYLSCLDIFCYQETRSKTLSAGFWSAHRCEGDPAFVRVWTPLLYWDEVFSWMEQLPISHRYPREGLRLVLLSDSDHDRRDLEGVVLFALSQQRWIFCHSSLVFFESQLMEIKFIQINYRWGAWKDTQSPNGGLDKWFKMMGSCQSRIDI